MRRPWHGSVARWQPPDKRAVMTSCGPWPRISRFTNAASPAAPPGERTRCHERRVTPTAHVPQSPNGIQAGLQRAGHRQTLGERDLLALLVSGARDVIANRL